LPIALQSKPITQLKQNRFRSSVFFGTWKERFRSRPGAAGQCLHGPDREQLEFGGNGLVLGTDFQFF